ncbi:TPA: hypothetical protein DD449_01775 [Candidatus Berkelbacteria bacterium]|uniref:ABC-2 type transporter n=1 Tax=Berkelbacteria bacterium GW2011_GWE1_39_12 TaxID=1618337 RepID=A0A0G4B3I8_9BACT|nr:MAG: ABC-2 type transporter [Berkelbacteria bacterium GW2011_GWE1_39_12]HBO60394.1 hypothetical protein [Candidatus Berkelbacteria bacterium]
MWSIIKRNFRDRRGSLLIYSAFSVALLWMYIALYPSFSNQTGSLEQLIASYPEGFLKAFNFDIKSFTTVEGFLATEQFSFVWPLLVILLSLSFSGSAFSGEIEDGTMQILLSQPISRLKLFFSKYLSGLLMIILFTFISIYTVIPLNMIYDIPYKSDNFFTLMILALLFAWSIYSIGIFFSSIFSKKGKVLFVTGMILVVMYVLNIISSIKDSLSDLKYFSFFYYFNPAKALVYNQVDYWSYLAFGIVIIFCSVAGLIYFNKRDAI